MKMKRGMTDRKRFLSVALGQESDYVPIFGPGSCTVLASLTVKFTTMAKGEDHDLR